MKGIYLFLCVLTTTTIITSSAQGQGVGNPFKGIEWTFVYENDASGAFVAGDLTELIGSVLNGADIKISWSNPPIFQQCDTVQTINTNSGVACQFKSVAMINGINPPVVRTPPYTVNNWFDTTGGTAITRANIYTGANLGSAVVTSGARWFVRR